IAGRWAALDPEAAISWVRSLEPGSGRTAAILGVGTSIAQIQPRTALELALELEGAAERNQLTQVAAALWLQSDPPAALEWADRVTEASIQRTVFRQHISNLLVSDDPRGAAGWIERISEPTDRNAMVSRVSEAWGRKDSQAAWQWGTTMLEGEARSIAIQQIL